MVTKLEEVKFKNDFVEMVVIAGKNAVDKVNNNYLVSVRKVCENLGIDYNTQKFKLKAEAELYETQLVDVPTNGGVQKVFCIPLSKLNGWLFTISPNRVKPETKQKLIAYQKECFDVLFNHFTQEATKTYQPQQNLFGEVDKQMVEELIKRSDVVRGYQGQIAKLENELAKKQSEIINLKNKIEHQHMQTLELSAIKMFLEQVDKIKSDLDLITAVLSSEPKPIPGGHNISWGKTIFPANPSKNRLVKEIKEAINKNSKCPF